jgi:hypothetical protein
MSPTTSEVLHSSSPTEATPRVHHHHGADRFSGGARAAPLIMTLSSRLAGRMVSSAAMDDDPAARAGRTRVSYGAATMTTRCRPAGTGILTSVVSRVPAALIQPPGDFRGPL